jgi:hypothetical protein
MRGLRWSGNNLLLWDGEENEGVLLTPLVEYYFSLTDKRKGSGVASFQHKPSRSVIKLVDELLLRAALINDLDDLGDPDEKTRKWIRRVCP